jgi:hypothetical protein
MKTIYVKYYDPSEVMEGSINTLDKSDVLRYCFRAIKYTDPTAALNAYANTICTWSTLLEDDADVDKFIETAYDALKRHDLEWLEEHFV